VLILSLKKGFNNDLMNLIFFFGKVFFIFLCFFLENMVKFLVEKSSH